MWKLFVADLKMIVRNRQAAFWALMFPLIFTCIFGLFFGKDTTVGTIAIINNSNSQIATGLESAVKDSKVFSVNNSTDLNDAKDQIKRSKISAVLVIPESFGDFSKMQPEPAKIVYDQGSAQVAQSLSGLVEKYNSIANMQIAKVQPVLNSKLEPVSDKKLTYFDFVLAGVLGLALMNSSIIGIAVGMAKYREDKILKRITTTPVKSWHFITAEVLSRLILNVIQIAIILLVGHYVFDAHIYGNLWVIFAVAMVGAILFQLLGFVVASFSKTTDAAQGLATVLTIPMMFLAGVFFPIDALPSWLYSIVQYLPLAPLLRILRTVVLEAGSPFLEPKNAIIIICWIIGTLIISALKFRLSDE